MLPQVWYNDPQFLNEETEAPRNLITQLLSDRGFKSSLQKQFTLYISILD